MLIVVLWLLMVLGFVVLGLNRSTQLLQARSRGALAQVQARWVARAGVERAFERLDYDLTAYDWSGDEWYDDPGMFDAVELADGFMFWVTAPVKEGDPDDAARFGLDDESSRMTVNAYGNAALTRLLENLNSEANAQTIIDWRDGNSDQPPGGAEATYYADLRYPYDIANAPFRTHRELMLVKGITPELFFGEDTNRNGRLDFNENDGDRLAPADDSDGTLNRGLAGVTSVYAYRLNQTMTGTPPLQFDNINASQLQTRFFFSDALAEAAADRMEGQDDIFRLVGLRGNGEAEDGEIDEIDFEWVANHYEDFTDEEDEVIAGRVNINTARRAVLEALPQLPDEAVSDILAAREQGTGFTRIGGLFTSNILDEDEFRRVAPRVTVRSNVFRVLSRGVAPGGGSVTVEAVIDRGGTRPVVLYWHER